MGTVHKSLELETRDESLEYGILRCTDCKAEFPVVAGIPLLLPADSRTDIYAETTQEVLIQGAQISDISTAIRNADKVKALALLLNPLNLTAPSWAFTLPEPEELPSRRKSCVSPAAPTKKGKETGKQRLSMPLRLLYRRCRARYRKFMLPRWQLKLAHYLQRHEDQLSAFSVIDLYFNRFCGPTEIGPYFQCRFGQPRHLAALSVAQLMRTSPGPLLDVACGAGHLTHYLSYDRTSGPVVGIDRDFFRLFLAKKYIAPQAQFVCVDTEPELPFVSGLFEATLCSDAFHLMPFKLPMLIEIRRTLTATGSIFLARIGNSEVEPNEGYELDVDGYADLLADMPCSMVGEEELTNRYLRGLGPDLSRGVGDPALRQDKWLTLVATHRSDLLIEDGDFTDWPHAVGRLDINPIYISGEVGKDGEQDYVFGFPTAWYEFENAAYQEYASSSFSISEEARSRLNHDRSTEWVQRHVDQYEVLGMPERYLNPRT